MAHVEKKQVWREIPRATARANGWKVVPTRWIDVNKGDLQRPNYRSRFVAKEFNTGPQEGLFAATPPLEAMRLLVSLAATGESVDQCDDHVIMVNDVSRAFFEAPARRVICIELPAEAGGDGSTVGLVQKSLYGTRDAATNFQAEVAKVMVVAGFERSRYSPSVFFSPSFILARLAASP